MRWVEVVLIAAGLSMDTFAVAIATGTAKGVVAPRQTLLMAAVFGAVHVLMILAGWAGGETLLNFISGVDHWIAFLLLSFVGLKMLWEARHPPGERTSADSFEPKQLALLAVATSLDALATGLSFSFLNIAIVPAALIVGAAAFSFTAAGLYAGMRCGKLLAQRAEALGGLMLVAIGIKILAEH
ncbi:MAG: manganese efflux pump MntP family protein [Elusimicrobiaceae bacterium]|nr:manganese efflux pump MntP family protein [Elusimicrobiaceae bacterium]